MTLLEELQKLKETQFTSDVVIPLLQKIYPKARIEYTHSATEAGRDLVLFSKEPLDHEKIICVQVKVTPLSYGANAIGHLHHTLSTARREGVTCADGSVRIPHEVLFITSKLFPENERRQVRSTLEDLEKNSIRVIAGEQFAKIVEDEAPELAATVLSPEALSIAEITRSLFSHSESRAFGLLPEMRIDQFYVTATISPSHDDAYLVLDGLLDISTTPVILPVIPKIVFEEYVKSRNIKASSVSSGEIEKALAAAAISKARLRQSLDNFNLKYTARLIEPSTVAKLKKEKHQVEIAIELEISDCLRQLATRAREALASCPSELGSDTTNVHAAVKSLQTLQEFVRFCDGPLNQELEIRPRECDPERRRIRLPAPEHILNLGKRVVLDGPPGCGKTTLMKVTAVRLLQRNNQVRLIPCSQIPKTEKSRRLEEIVAKYCSIAKKPTSDKDILLFDALDEGPAWLTSVIFEATSNNPRVIMSTRTAYLKSIVGDFINLRLAPFATDERDIFFERWLIGRAHIQAKAKELIKQHEDLDFHTRLPLLATVLVSLLVRGKTPDSRAAVYEQRLQLLLSDWDLYRSIGRVLVDDPSAKRRLLKGLAFHMHTKRARLASTSTIAKVYADVLGKKGLSFSFDDMLSDLTTVNSILIEEAPDLYSFGHLTFQEHLVGQYLHDNTRPRDVASYIGDPWWREPLNFWASIEGNIDSVIRILQRGNGLISNARQLQEMIVYAPYTSQGALEAISDSVDYMAADEVKEGLNDFS